MSLNEKCALTLIAIFGILGFLWAYLHAGGSFADFNGPLDLTTMPNTSPHEPSIVPVDDKILHFCPPEKLHKQVKARHSYPTYAGENITRLIHRGFSSIELPAPKDAAWYNCPPSNSEYSL